MRQRFRKIVSNPICCFSQQTDNEFAKFAAFEFCARSGVADCVLFGRVAGPTVGHRTLLALPLKGRISTLCCVGLVDSGIMPNQKREAIADRLSAAAWSWGCCSAVTKYGWRWIVDAHGDNRRYIASTDLLVAILKASLILAQRKLSLQRTRFSKRPPSLSDQKTRERTCAGGTTFLAGGTRRFSSRPDQLPPG